MDIISIATLALTGLLSVERVNKHTNCLAGVSHLRSSCCGVNIDLSRRNSQNGRASDSPTQEKLDDISKALKGISQRQLSVPEIVLPSINTPLTSGVNANIGKV